MRILLTNDDGVHADGLFALYQALSEVGVVTVVAPERQQSATGHAITLHKPLRLSPVLLRDGSAAFSSNGTPSDCAALGILETMGGEVDLVVSGINHGPNLGWDVHYSGTVSAAIEAAMIGKPSIAVSVASWDDNIHWEPAANFAAQVARRLLAQPLPPNTILNINAPNLPQSELAGVAVTTQGRRQYVDRIEKRLDPVGRPYYWLGGSLAEEAAGAEAGSDVRAVADGKISITPIHLDLTAYSLLPSLKEWDSYN
ncbi:MAG: 5'/3'-nucleotidase SurE [Janthinobacterium lividum]